MYAASPPCGRRCGAREGDDRWDHPSLRRPAGQEWSDVGFVRLRNLDFRDLMPVHEEAASHGRTTGKGLVKEHFMIGIWGEFQGHLAERLNPVYIAARWVKHSVMHRPFKDANRRTAFLWTAILFDAFDLYIQVHTPEAIEYKSMVRNEPFVKTYAWFAHQVARARAQKGGST